MGEVPAATESRERTRTGMSAKAFKRAFLDNLFYLRVGIFSQEIRDGWQVEYCEDGWKMRAVPSAL